MAVERHGRQCVGMVPGLVWAYAGGTVTDPQGPDSNAIGFKVIRGGAWESSEFDCRSARRSIEGAHPFISDFIIGFRVVLVTGQ